MGGGGGSSSSIEAISSIFMLPKSSGKHAQLSMTSFFITAGIKAFLPFISLELANICLYEIY